MTDSYLIGVDCGTQSAKVVLYDAAGNAVARGQRALRPMSRPRHGVAIHPDDDLWESIGAASRDAMAAFTGDVSAIKGVGLCPIRCCKAFLKADGSLVEPVISWMDDRAYQPYVPDDPEVVYATTSSGYLAHRFTGEFRDTAANNILLQWPIDTDSWRWSDDPALYEQFRVTRDMLLELQMPGDVIGRLTPDAAAATGMPAGIPVVATANDKAVEMLGAGSLGETTLLVSLGTYIAAMVHGRENHKNPTNFWTNFACMPNRYLYESNGVRRGMWTLTWFLDLTPLGPKLESEFASGDHQFEFVITSHAGRSVVTVRVRDRVDHAEYAVGLVIGSRGEVKRLRTRLCSTAECQRRAKQLAFKVAYYFHHRAGKRSGKRVGCGCHSARCSG